MLAVPQEYVGALCEIKSLSNDLLATGRIIKIDQSALELAAAEDDRIPLLQYRMPVKLFIYSAREGTRVLVGIVYLSTENFVRVEEIKPLQDFERRGAFRVNTMVTGRLNVLLSEEEQAAFDAALAAASPAEAEKMLHESVLEVRLMDISLTGARLQSPVPLNPGARYFIEFSLFDTPMSLCLSVQRLIRMSEDEVQYGCSFFDFSERQMDALCKELFQMQRLEKSRRGFTVGAD
jgi:hypothetical protein